MQDWPLEVAELEAIESYFQLHTQSTDKQECVVRMNMLDCCAILVAPLRPAPILFIKLRYQS